MKNRMEKNKKNKINVQTMTDVIRKPPAGLAHSEFGCRNCLWAAAECADYSLYVPADDWQGHKTCGNYVYYD